MKSSKIGFHHRIGTSVHPDNQIRGIVLPVTSYYEEECDAVGAWSNLYVQFRKQAIKPLCGKQKQTGIVCVNWLNGWDSVNIGI